MKVAVFHNLPSGGAKRALHGILREFAACGDSVRAYLPDTADESYLPLSAFAESVRVFPVRTTLHGAVISTLRYIPPLRISLADLQRTQERIAAEINNSDCDAVWVEQDRFVMSPFVLRHLRKPFVYLCPQVYRSGAEKTLADAVTRCNRSFIREAWRRLFLYRVIPAIDRKNVSFAPCVLANSFFTRQAILKEYGIQASVCYPGVDIRVFCPMDLPRSDYLLSVGSLTPGKGYDFLIRSLANLDPATRPLLRIVANAAEPRTRRYLQEMAVQAGVRMEIMEQVSDERLAEIYSRAVLFTYTPYHEPLGLAPLEALACGTPVVGVREGGLCETVVDGETGLLTDRDESAFAQALRRLLEDGALRREMGNRGSYSIRQSWGMPVAAERARQYLQQVCGR